MNILTDYRCVLDVPLVLPMKLEVFVPWLLLLIVAILLELLALPMIGDLFGWPAPRALSLEIDPFFFLGRKVLGTLVDGTSKVLVREPAPIMPSLN